MVDVVDDSDPSEGQRIDERQALAACEAYRKAMESHDQATLLSLISERYHEDGGNDDPSDDADFDDMKTTIESLGTSVRVQQYALEVRAIRHQDDGSIAVDVHYRAVFEQDGIGQFAREADTTLVLVREGDTLRFSSGM